MRRYLSLVLALLATLSASSAQAVVTEFTEDKKKAQVRAQAVEKLIWRNSLFTYTNAISAISLNQNAEPDYNPYWVMDFGFRPRVYIRDDLSLRANLDLEVEITSSDSTDRQNELLVSDLTLDLNYGPTWMKIPVADIYINPSIRLQFPTSKVSRARTMVLALSPALAFRKSFRVLSGNWLNTVGLGYSFRFTKYFHESKYPEYTDPGRQSVGAALDPTRSDFYSIPGLPNASMRFFNSFSVFVGIYKKLMFSAGATIVSELDYAADEYTLELGGGLQETIPPTSYHLDPLFQVSFDLTYDLMRWLGVSVGASTFWHQLGPDGTNYQPIFNRNTVLYLTFTLTTDQFYRQIKDWASSPGAGDGSGGGVAEPASAR